MDPLVLTLVVAILEEVEETVPEVEVLDDKL